MLLGNSCKYEPGSRSGGAVTPAPMTPAGPQRSYKDRTRPPPRMAPQKAAQLCGIGQTSCRFRLAGESPSVASQSAPARFRPHPLLAGWR